MKRFTQLVNKFYSAILNRMVNYSVIFKRKVMGHWMVLALMFIASILAVLYYSELHGHPFRSSPIKEEIILSLSNQGEKTLDVVRFNLARPFTYEFPQRGLYIVGDPYLAQTPRQPDELTGRSIDVACNGRTIFKFSYSDISNAIWTASFDCQNIHWILRRVI